MSTTAVIYARQSMHNDRSIERQEQTGRERAESQGWTIHDVYRDGVSASRYARKQRTEWPRLLVDLARPEVGVLWLWETSRGDRDLTPWSAMLDRCREHGVRIYVETHARLYDVTNGRDWRTLAEDGVDNGYESEKVSNRVTSAMAEAAAKGRPHGRIPYGYRRVYDPETGRVEQVPDPDEAPVIAELYDRIAKGHAIRAIANDYEARGVRRRDGGTFSPSHLRDLVTRDLYRGKRVHVAGRKDGKLPDGADVERVDADWEALVPESLWLDVNRRVGAPERRTSRPGRGKHLLSMIVRCDACGSIVHAIYKNDTRRYRCREHSCVIVSADDLDAYAEAVVLGYLTRPDLVDELTADEGDDAAIEEARAIVEQVRAELDELADQVGRGELSATLAARSEPQILDRLKGAEARLAELSTPSKLRGLIDPGADVRQRWAEAPMSARREIVRLLFSPEYLGELRLARTPRPGVQVPIEERVVWKR